MKMNSWWLCFFVAEYSIPIGYFFRTKTAVLIITMKKGHELNRTISCWLKVERTHTNDAEEEGNRWW
jgi:hypothetical protein